MKGRPDLLSLGALLVVIVSVGAIGRQAHREGYRV